MRRRSQSHVQSQDDVPSPTKKLKIDQSSTQDITALTKYIKNSKTIQTLHKKGIKSFFPVQYSTFQLIYNGRDLIARDRTGSGKTIGFSLPIIQRFRDQNQFESNKTKFLIILPTRQLAIQVKNEIVSIKNRSSQFQVVNVYGGADIQQQIRLVKEGADIIVATPGRLLDLLQRDVIKLKHLQVTCLDEADQMLKQGFQEDIEKVFQYIKKNTLKKTQNLLFSATIPQWVHEIARKYLAPQKQFIDLIKNTEIKTSKTVEHLAINCPYFSRNSVISDVVNLYGGRHGRTIIFCQTKKQVNQIILKANLKQQNQPLHGDIPQKQRQVTFKSFKEGKLKCLVATNVAARGLDIPQVDLIVQLEPPKDVQTYIHRSGRTGRAGRSGVCVTFFTKTQASLIQRIQRVAKLKFKKTGAPQPVDIIKASARDIVISLKSVNESVLPYFSDIAEQMINEQGNPIKALSKALAYISGNTQKISQRSLLCSIDGFITYILKTPVEFNSNSYIYNFFRSSAPERLISQIKGMRKYGRDRAVFDVPEYLKPEMDKLNQFIKEQKGRVKGFTLEIATSLEELQEEQNNHKGEQTQVTEQIDQRTKRQAYRRKKQLQVFVGGLPYNADQGEVTEFFKRKKVTIVTTRILKSQQGESKGIAFVLCADDRSLKNALGLNGERFGARTIKINLASNR